MKKQFRVKKNEEFDAIIKNRKFASSKAFTIYYKNKKEEYGRIGIAVPTKLGNAVFRNKTKRQIKNMLHNLDHYELKYDLIIIVRPKYLSQSYTNNKKDLEKLMKTVKI